MTSLEVQDRTEPQTSPETVNFGQDVMNSIDAISQPMELSDLGASRAGQPTTESQTSKQQEAKQNTSVGPAEAERHSQEQPSTAAVTEAPSAREDSAIGPPTDKHTNVHSTSTHGPQLVITLLLHSTDTRHPYIINEKYLKKRNISVTDNDPVNLTVYNLKDLIWRDWREEWETRPASPTSIRLIHMGRMLEDKTYLKDSRFSTGDTPHVVHMTVKPQEVIDDEDARIAKGGNRDRDGNERTPGCRCNIM